MEHFLMVTYFSQVAMAVDLMGHMVYLKLVMFPALAPKTVVNMVLIPMMGPLVLDRVIHMVLVVEVNMAVVDVLVVVVVEDHHFSVILMKHLHLAEIILVMDMQSSQYYIRFLIIVYFIA